MILTNPQQSNPISVLYDDILYIEGCKDYLKIYTKNRNSAYMFLMTMQEVMSLLPSKFVRPHRSYIVNMSYIDEIRDRFLFIQGTIIPISRIQKKEFLSKIPLLKN